MIWSVGSAGNFVRALSIAGMLALPGGAAMAQDLSAANAIEYVTFAAKDGASPEELAKVAVAVNETLKDYDGFVGRFVSRQEDGTWVGVVYWRDLAAAKASLEKFLADKRNAALAMVDTESVKLS